MSSLAQAIQRLLLVPDPTPTARAKQLLAGLPGRGANGFARQLRDWLDSARAWMPESIQVEYIDHPQDHGIDVLVSGDVSKMRVGVQIKSDNDLRRKDFQRELKAQITETQAWGLSLLVIMFACDPYPPNEARIQYFIMESRRYLNPRLLVVQPERAAGLLAAFGEPVPSPMPDDRTWTDFLSETEQSALIPLYVDRWHPLLPDERFQAPACLQEVQESLCTNAITCLVGPPATGKTFLASMVARRHWLERKPVTWVASPTFLLTEGPIPNSAGHDLPPV